MVSRGRRRKQAVVMPFTIELSRLSPQEFVQNILVEQLPRANRAGPVKISGFGHKQAGDTQLLRELAAPTIRSGHPALR